MGFRLSMEHDFFYWDLENLSLEGGSLKIDV